MPVHNCVVKNAWWPVAVGRVNGAVSSWRRPRTRSPIFGRRSIALGIRPARQAAGLACAAAGLSLVTLVMTRVHPQLAVIVLVYLLTVVITALVGGFASALLAAVASSLLLNWFFTPPLHAWNVGSEENLFALLLFVAIALIVSAVVHLAARRAILAERLSIETKQLMELARTILSGADTAGAVLEHFEQATGHHAELLEFASGRWNHVAGRPLDGARPSAMTRVAIGEKLRLDVVKPGSAAVVSRRLLEGYGNQAAAALDRERLRLQAARAQALAEANRLRSALLAAVSHDLRTPLASVKAAVSSLRQSDVAWSDQDRSELLATIEAGADRLNSLISNLLDMSRIHTGTLQPCLRPLALDEVAPLALRGIEGGERVRLDVPDDLPLIHADAVLLERVLANLLANALRYSPRARPPIVSARSSGDVVAIEVIDFGPGVPDDERSRMFEPFEQLGNRRAGSGVGLGLAVASGFVDAMGGRLFSSTTLGGGLTMRLEFSACAAPSSIRDDVRVRTS